MFAYPPARRGPTPRRMSRGDIEATFPAWKVTEERVNVSLPKFLRADPSGTGFSVTTYGAAKTSSRRLTPVAAQVLT
jgi:hypothetical protein